MTDSSGSEQDQTGSMSSSNRFTGRAESNRASTPSDEVDVVYVGPAEDADPSNSGSSWLSSVKRFALPGAGALLSLGALAAFIVLRRRSNQSPETEETTPSSRIPRLNRFRSQPVEDVEVSGWFDGPWVIVGSGVGTARDRALRVIRRTEDVPELPPSKRQVFVETITTAMKRGRGSA